MKNYLKSTVYVTFLLGLCPLLFAQTSVSDMTLEQIERMESRGDFELIEGSSEVDLSFQYEGQRRSMIQWDNISVDDWLDFDAWKEEREVKDQWPHWRVTLRQQNLVEPVGRVLECHGTCLISRDDGEGRARYRSGLLEGDEVRTLENSFAWIYLLDGTMVRLSAESSISLLELNIGKERIFHHARINKGQVSWISRQRYLFEEIDKRETDPIFLPLSKWQANYESLPEYVQIDSVPEDHQFLPMLKAKRSPHAVQVERLNQKIQANNEKINEKDSHVFLVMPNGTVEGVNPFLELVSLPNAHSYIKQKAPEHYSFADENLEYNQELVFLYRGFENTGKTPLIPGQWMRVSTNGRRIERASSTQELNFSELLTRRVPTIFIAREMFLSEYGPLVYNVRDGQEMARNGRRLWEEDLYGSEEATDIDLRLGFLREYSRRLETSNLQVRSVFYEQLEQENQRVITHDYDSRYYSKAYDFYVRNPRVMKEKKRRGQFSERTLNSKQRSFWNQLQVQRMRRNE